MDEWSLFKNNDLTYLSIDNWLKAGVNLAFSTRHGGESTGCFESCNLGLHVGDDLDRVLANRCKFLQAFQADLGQAVCCQQVHEDLILKIDASHQGRGVFDYAQSLANCDGMITNIPGVHLLTFYADCIPIYFFDPVHRAIGMAHSGWKGTMAHIAIKTLQAMEQAYASRKEDLYIAIGPGIGPCCFEIADNLAEQVVQGFPGYQNIIIQKDSDGCHWDLPATNRLMLINAGVNPEHISNCNLCTACHPEWFFSYRRDKGETGRMGALIALER